MSNRAVFLDRDGVINQMVYHDDFGIIDSPLNPDEFVLIKGAPEAIKRFNELNFKVIVVSNQPGVAKAKITLEILTAINNKMIKELDKYGAKIDDIFQCLDHPTGTEGIFNEYIRDSEFRKPKPGMILKAAEKYSIDLKKSYMVGDGITDIQAGAAAGCKTVFLGSYKCETCKKFDSVNVHPNFIMKDLYEFSKKILFSEKDRT
jgi:histidinol-phosphate phosphatase family protein